MISASPTSCLLGLRVSRTFLYQLRSQLFRPWIPSAARGIDGGPRRSTEVVLTEPSLLVAWRSRDSRNPKWAIVLNRAYRGRLKSSDPRLGPALGPGRADSALARCCLPIMAF